MLQVNNVAHGDQNRLCPDSFHAIINWLHQMVSRSPSVLHWQLFARQHQSNEPLVWSSQNNRPSAVLSQSSLSSTTKRWFRLIKSSLIVSPFCRNWIKSCPVRKRRQHVVAALTTAVYALHTGPTSRFDVLTAEERVMCSRVACQALQRHSRSLLPDWAVYSGWKRSACHVGVH